MPTDKERLDFLQDLTDKKAYNGQVILRDSTSGRGWRLHETSQEGASSSVRDAIDKYIMANKQIQSTVNSIVADEDVNLQKGFMEKYRLLICPAFEKCPSDIMVFKFETKSEMLAASNCAAELLLCLQNNLYVMENYSNSFDHQELINGEWEMLEEKAQQ